MFIVSAEGEGGEGEADEGEFSGGEGESKGYAISDSDSFRELAHAYCEQYFEGEREGEGESEGFVGAIRLTCDEKQAY